MSKIDNVSAVASLDWETDADTENGYVAKVPTSGADALQAKFRAAGFEASVAADHDDRSVSWLYVA